MTNDTADGPLIDQLRKFGKRLAKFGAEATLATSASLCVAIVVCYTWRLDAWAAVTVFPIWFWPLAGIVLVAAARRQVRRRYALSVALAWCIVLAVFADHPLSLLRLRARGAA
ncbi:MAG TPA: hypothetical protein VGX78_10775, partial [Pirellulales bacterium]|nr:hypothetical protein [Pirellulales bacterium]